MGCAYVVLAHKDPTHLRRLVQALQPAPVFLHVDARVPDAAARSLYAAAGDARPLRRHATGWASWELVEAALEGLRAALKTDAGHVALLSGQDYPLRSADGLDRFFDEHEGRSFCHVRALPYKNLGRDGGLRRVRYWHAPVRGRKLMLPVPRRMPDGIVAHHGQQWCVFAREAVERVLELHQRRPELARFYRRTWIPDEGFLPTLLMSSDVAQDIDNENLWYVRWAAGSHPAVLDAVGELDELSRAASGPSKRGGRARIKLFARKFETERSDELLDAVDARLRAAALG